MPDESVVAENLESLEQSLQEIIDAYYQSSDPQEGVARTKEHQQDASEALDAAAGADPTDEERETIAVMDDAVDLFNIFTVGLELTTDSMGSFDEAYELFDQEAFDQAIGILDDSDAQIDVGRATLYTAEYELEAIEDELRAKVDHLDVDEAFEAFDEAQEGARVFDWLTTGLRLLAVAVMGLEQAEEAFDQEEDFQFAREHVEDASDQLTASLGTFEHITRLEVEDEYKQIAEALQAEVRQLDNVAEKLEDACLAATTGEMERALELFAEVEQEADTM